MGETELRITPRFLDSKSKQTGKIDLVDRVWSGEEKELNLGQATFMVQRSSRLLDLGVGS